MNESLSIPADEAAVAVIGYGTAGVNALIGLRNTGYEGPVRVFSDTAIDPYSPILTSYFAGGEKTYAECFPWEPDELAELGADVLRECPVTRLDVAAHLVRTADGDFPYTKCVIATGATPQVFGWPAGCPYEPHVLRTMADAERLKAALEDPSTRRVLVSGASMIALKALEACLRRGKDVELVGMNPHILDFNALPEAAERYERGLRAKGVALRFSETIADVAVVEGAEDGRLEVTFSSGDVERFDEIVCAHGVRSNLGFLEPGALPGDRAVAVDGFMRTSDPDVYAAGDVAQSIEMTSGSRRVVGIWRNAALQGYTAGAAIAAELAGREPEPAIAFHGSIPMNTIVVDDVLFISAGVATAGEGRRTDVQEDDEMTVIRIFEQAEDGERLVGFNLVADHDVPGGRAYDIGAMLTMRIESAVGLR